MDIGYVGLAPADFNVTASGVAGAAVQATQAAPSATETLIASGIEFSLSAAPAAAVTVQLVSDFGGAPTVLWQVDMPAAALGPQVVEFRNAIKGVAGKNLSLSIAAPGGAVVAKANLRGFQRTIG